MIIINNRQLNVTTFPNKETTLRIEDGLLKEHNTIIWKFESNDEIFLLNQLESVIKNTEHQSSSCHILYLPYSRMDRYQENNPFSLKVLYNLLPKSFDYTIYEPHSDVLNTLQIMYNRLKSLTFKYFTPVLLEEAKKHLDILHHNTSHVLVLPDEGAYNRYIKQDLLKDQKQYFDAIVYCEKDRTFSNGKINGLKIKNPQVLPDEYVAVIVDDLSSFGNTFIKTKDALKETGVKETYLVAAHAEESVFKGNLLDHIDGIFTSNSITNMTTLYINHVFIFTTNYLIQTLKERGA